MWAYVYLAKTKFLESLVYRFEIFTTIIGQIVIMVASVFFWKAAYSGTGEIAGTSLKQMTVYTVMSVLLSVCHSTSVEQRIYSSVRHGSVSLDLMKPIGIMKMYLALDFGIIFSSFIIKFIPVFVAGSLLFGLPAPASPPAFLLFLLSMWLGFAILWVFNAIFGMFTFWFIEIQPFRVAKDYIVHFLSGSFVPLWFFPSWFTGIINFFPFMHIYQTPLGIYIGRQTIREGLFSVGIQLVWIVILLVILNIINKKAYKKVISQGG